ncbi:MAG: MFS transporter [Anaerolineae bacterium]
MTEQQQTDQSTTFQAGRVLTIAAGHMLHDTYTGFLAPLLPVFITNLDLSKTQAGILTMFLQGPSLLQPAIGHLADRLDLRYLVFLGPATAAVMMSLLGIAPNYAVLVLFLTVAGVNAAGFHSVGPAIAGQLSGRRLGQGMSFWMAGAEIARTLSPLVVVTALQFLGIRGLPWLMLLGLLGSALLYMRLRDISFQPATTAQPTSWKQALRDMRGVMLPLAGVLIFRAFIVTALTTYLPILLREQGSDLWLAGASLSLVQGGGAVGALMAGSLSDRFGRRSTVLATLLIAPPLLLTFLAVDGWLRLPLLLLLGFATISNNPILMALVQESFPANRAMANGLYLAMTFVFSSIMAVVVGMLGDLFGLRLAFVASAIAPLLGVPLMLLLPGGKAQPS